MPRPLTERQQRILELIVDGHRDWSTMAEELHVSPSTVRRDVRDLCAAHDCRMAELPERVHPQAA